MGLYQIFEEYEDLFAQLETTQFVEQPWLYLVHMLTSYVFLRKILTWNTSHTIFWISFVQSLFSSTQYYLSLKSTRRYSPLRGPTFCSCRQLGPLAKDFYARKKYDRQKCNFMNTVFDQKSPVHAVWNPDCDS